MAEFSDGAEPFQYLSTADTNPHLVLGRRCRLEGVFCINITAVVYYLKFYDKVTAPIAASDTPVLTFPIPASTSGAGVSLPFPNGIRFMQGMGICLTGALAINDTTNAATGVLINLIAR